MGRKSKKEYLKEQIKQLINQEKLDIGDKLPSETELANRLMTSHMTIRGTLALLAADNIIEAKPGSGTYLKQLPAQTPKQTLVNHKLVAIFTATEGHIFQERTELLSKKLQKNGFIPILISTPDLAEDDLKNVKTQLKEAIALGCRRLIASPSEWLFNPNFPKLLPLSEIIYSTQWERLIWLGTKTFLPSDIQGSSIDLDSNARFKQALTHLTELGHKNITFLTHRLRPDSQSESVITIRNYCQQMSEFGLAEHIRIISQQTGDEKKEKLAHQVLNNSPRPTAIISDGDFRFASIINAAKELGINIPHNLSLIGHYNTPWAEFYNLTSFDYDWDHYTDLLLKLLKTAEQTQKHEFIQPQLIVRQSTGKLKQ